jgi:hypothetical protein
MKINSIEFLEDDNEREITVSIGEEKVHITPCHESYEQWGATIPAYKMTQPLAQFFLPWLQDNMSLQDFIKSKNIE